MIIRWRGKIWLVVAISPDIGNAIGEEEQQITPLGRSSLEIGDGFIQSVVEMSVTTTS